MRFLLIAFAFSSLQLSCKLMNKEDEAENRKNNNNMSSGFKKVDWMYNTNIYEVNVRQYTTEGTFKAFAQHLQPIKDLGVKTLWFMPITPIAQKNKKGSLGSYYACSDYTAINPEFGTLDDFKALVNKAHAMGFKVIIDWVANHTGWDHRWTKEHPDYFIKDTATNDFQIASGMDDIIELDFNNPALRKAMIDAMQFWVDECDIDGFRCDLAFWVELDFWKEARTKLETTKPLFWLGEFDELEKPEYAEAFDASYTWSWMHKAKDFYQNHLAVDSLYAVLKKYDEQPKQCLKAWFTSNHDENSWNGTEYEKYGDMAKALAVFSCTWNGIPLVYTGQEVANKKRILFFDKDTVQWADNNPMRAFYKTLLTLHSDNPALSAGDTSAQTILIDTNQPNKIFSYLRKKGNNEVLVLINFSAEKDVSFAITDESINGIYKSIFSNTTYHFPIEKQIKMQPWEYLVLTK